MIVKYNKAIPEIYYSINNEAIFTNIKTFYSNIEAKDGTSKCSKFYSEYQDFDPTVEAYSLESVCPTIGNGIMNSDLQTIQAKVIDDLRYAYLMYNNSTTKTRKELMDFLLSDAFSIDYIIVDAYLRKVDEMMRYSYFEKINSNSFIDLKFYTVILFMINMLLEFGNILLIKYVIVNYISKKIKYYSIFIQSLLISNSV